MVRAAGELVREGLVEESWGGWVGGWVERKENEWVGG